MRALPAGPPRLDPFLLRLSTLLLLALLVAPECLAGSYMANLRVRTDGERLTRTYPGPRGQPAPRTQARGGDAFEMTGERFAQLYPIGSELHVRYTAEDEVFEMFVGFGDLVTPQTIRLPAVTYDETNVWLIADPADTPYAADYPAATHVLVSTPESSPDETVFLYYDFAPEALRYQGSVAVPTDGGPIEREALSLVVLVFPANAEAYLYEENPHTREGVEGIISEEAGMHIFGTFEADDATAFDMGTFFFDHFWSDPTDPDGAAYGYSDYSVLGDEGSLVFFEIAANPTGGDTEIEGDVYISNVEYVQVVAPPTAAEAGPDAGPAWSVYPNPAADVVRFSETLDVTLYDVLGRAVRSGDGVQSLDVGSLPAGLYVARTQAGESRPLVIR